MYAIVDIETTGGKFNRERITEIAIYRYDGHDIIDKFVSLVNPEQKIQNFVIKLTGITDKMVKKAPKFQEVAKRIVEITQGCKIVAHNANFDYRVLRNEFSSLGFNFEHDTLCTVELSQALIPDMPSYSLGKLCKSLGIPIANRHRADGDAFATVSLFELLLQKDNAKDIISESIKEFYQIAKKEKLTNLIKSVPTSTGVFYIHQANGRIMYIGKAPNMQKKVAALLVKKSKKAMAIQSKLAKISYDESGNITVASLIFNQEVSKHKPRFNSNFFRGIKPIEFIHPDMLLLYKGRRTGEKSVICIKEGIVKGFAYTDLEIQLHDRKILEKKLNVVEDSLDNRYVVKRSLEMNKVNKIIRL